MLPKKYVPILKAKAGEKWALAALKPASKKYVTPLLELPTIPKPSKDKKTGTLRPAKSLTEHIAKQVKGVADSWGTATCYLDTRWLYATHGDAALSATFDAARKLGIKAIPIIQPASTAATIGEVKKIVKADGRGVMLRAKANELGRANDIKAAITAVGLTVGDVDFLLDYRSQPMSLPVELPMVAAISSLSDWRELIAASGVFPESVANCKDGAWHELSRTCWTTWAVGVKGVARAPVFGDFAVRSPGAPASGGDPPVTLRYTTDKNWLVRVDGSLQGGHAKRMHALCAELIGRTEYAGKDFSAGDSEIEKTATHKNPTPGAATQWLQWAISHHLEHVVHQLG